MDSSTDYDAETDKLIDFLFSDGTNEEYQENPDILKYLSIFGSMTVDQLHKEKKVLDEEISSVDNQMRNLALANYKSFIHTAKTSHTIYQNICSVEKLLELFCETIPNLLKECEKFAGTSTEIRERKRKNNLILSNHNEILQILEIPQFMNACIRSKHYEEALLLPSFVKRLSSKHCDIALIQNIAESVDRSWWELMRHLRHLRSDITLPQCLQIVGYLRRMNVFTEVQLRIKFLQARGLWFDSLLAGISNDDKLSHLNAVIDVTRVSIFNIATQYKAVFTDDEVVIKQNDLKNSIFYSWLNKKINDFLRTVESDLTCCPPNSMDSLLGQCMYFGQSFGRIGADFRGLTIGYFVKVVERNFETAIRGTDEQFLSNMQKFELPKSNVVSSISLLKESNQDKQFLSPATSLLEYYPLAVYCNGVLSAFNDLRYCTPIGCMTRITSILQSSLEYVSKSLHSFYEKENITWIDSERESFDRMCIAFVDDLLKFLQHCLTALFEPEKIAKYLAVSTSYLEDKKFGFLNIAEIRKPIDSILYNRGKT